MRLTMISWSASAWKGGDLLPMAAASTQTTMIAITPPFDRLYPLLAPEAPASLLTLLAGVVGCGLDDPLPLSSGELFCARARADSKEVRR